MARADRYLRHARHCDARRLRNNNGMQRTRNQHASHSRRFVRAADGGRSAVPSVLNKYDQDSVFLHIIDFGFVFLVYTVCRPFKKAVREAY
jgi:hypothetical protein